MYNIYKFIKYYFYKITFRVPPAPLFLYLELTKNCNLKCKFCDYWKIKKDESKHTAEELSTSEIINLIEEVKRMGTLLVYLTGGEPLLRPDIAEIVREIKKRGLAVCLTTNATLFSEKIIMDLIKAGLRQIFISLDSPFPEVHDEIRGVNGTFEKVIQSIKTIKSIYNKMDISINTVITKKNFKHLIDIAKVARKLDIQCIKFMPIQKAYQYNNLCYLYPSQDRSLFFNTPDEINDLKEEIRKTINFLSKLKMETYSYEFLRGIPDFYKNRRKRLRCLTGYISCDIDSYGDIYHCYYFVEKVGNIRENSFSKIWNSEKFNNQRKSKINCQSCWQSCYIEPSIRFSLRYQIKNFPKLIKEYKRFIH